MAAAAPEGARISQSCQVCTGEYSCTSTVLNDNHTFSGLLAASFLGFPNPLLWQNTDNGRACTQSPGAGVEPTFSISNISVCFQQLP